MIWLAAQLWPAAVLALVTGFAITWFTVVRRLDDALLAVFGRRYIDLPGNAHRIRLLENRSERLT